MNPKEAYKDLFRNGRTMVEEIPIEDIEDFYIPEYGEHPFKVVDDEKLHELADEIAEKGVYVPAIVRPHPTDPYKYQMISGHRRKAASLMAGLQTLPCTIKQLSDEDAVQVMVNTNLQARETILPSEKAFAYKMQYEAMKKQGQRTDMITSSHDETKLRSDELLATQNKESRATIQRYIRLTYLIPQLLELVDAGRISLTPAVEISYIDEQGQEEILDYINNFDVTPNLSQALELKRKYSEGMLDEDVISSVLDKPKANQKEMYTLPMETINKYFKTKEKKIINNVVDNALNVYAQFNKDENVSLRISLAEVTGSAEVLTILSRDSAWEVREAVAKNDKCPPDIRRALSMDNDELVRNAAKSKSSTRAIR